MIIEKIYGRVSQLDSGVELDYLELEWHELNKRIFRMQSVAGREVVCRFTNENISLQGGDVLSLSDGIAVVVKVLPTECAVITPKSMVEMATVCYEIGNKHVPLFIDGEDILLPFEAPMFKWLEDAGFHPVKQSRVLDKRLKSIVANHHTSQHSHHHHSHEHGDEHHHHHTHHHHDA
ncbi:MAG: urease accessory protein UreE [Rikenellaceae bacterium]